MARGQRRRCGACSLASRALRPSADDRAPSPSGSRWGRGPHMVQVLLINGTDPRWRIRDGQSEQQTAPSAPQISPDRALESCVLSLSLGMRSDIVGDVMTLTIIILLAWLPLSALLALVVGGCIRLG